MAVRPSPSPPPKLREPAWLIARGPVRTALRVATDATHQRMHQLDPFRAIEDETLGAGQYRSLMHSLFQFHSAIGAAAERHGWTRLSSAAPRLALLRRDLRFLGGQLPSESIDWRHSSRSAALGGLYAAEGSMLGGRVIAGRLDYLLGQRADGRRFFIGSGGDGARWRSLLTALEEHCAAAAALDQAIDGALSVFDLFERCVSPPPGGERLHGSAGVATGRSAQFDGANR